MLSLNDQQVSFIEADLQTRGVSNSSLRAGLVDHICCMIEERIESYAQFEDEYQRALALFESEQTVEDIQQETTYLLMIQNQKNMKTTMKLTGNSSLVLLALGIISKMFHWPGANIMMILGFALLCIIFFPAVVYLQTNEGQTKRQKWQIPVLIGGISLMLGILFKVMHWNGASILMIVGWMVLLALFVPILVYTQCKQAQTATDKWHYVLGGIGIVWLEIGTMSKMQHWPGAAFSILLGAVLLVGIFLPLYTYRNLMNGKLGIGQFIFLIILSMYAVVMTSLMAFGA